MKISEQQYRIITLIFMLLPAAGLALFNIYLIRDIEANRRALANRVSLAESPVFIAAVEELRRGIREAKDIRYAVEPRLPKIRERGVGSWYAGRIPDGFGNMIGDDFLGKMTASGEEMADWNRTCAHRTLPFGTLVWILNVNNGKSSMCRINDRGPYGATVANPDGTVRRVVKLTENDPGNYDLIIDVNKRVGEDLGMLRAGSAEMILFY